MTQHNIYKSEGDAMTDGVAVQHNKVDVVNNLVTTSGTAQSACNDTIGAYTDKYSYKYQAAAAVDVVVKPSPGYLHAIVVGADVAGGIIEVSDHATDGDGNVQVYLADPAVGTYIVDAYFATGIAADITLQSNVTFIYR